MKDLHMGHNMSLKKIKLDKVHLSPKKTRRLRMILAESYVNPLKCEQYDPVLCEVMIPMIVLDKNSYRCMLCNKKLITSNEVIQHVLQEHKYELNEMIKQYIKRKYESIGIEIGEIDVL